MDRPPPVIGSRRPIVVLVLSAVLALGVAACGDDEEPTATGDGGTTTTASDDGGGGDPYGPPSGGGEGDSASKGTIVAKDYSLTDLTVAAGERIKLKNEGEFTHTATADDGEFDLGEVEPGETSDPGTAPEEPGTYAFHCEIHSNMTATLTVEG